MFPFLNVSCSLENLTIRMLLAPYFWNRRIYGFSSWPDGVIAVGQVFIVLEKSIVQLIHSVRLYLLCSESGFSQKGNSGTKSLAYTTLVRPILEYGAACRDPYREGQIYALDRVLKKATKCAYHTSESNWETLSQRRKISIICALFKAYSGERAWKVIGDRLQRPNYLSRIDHD